VTNDYLGFSWY